MAKDEGDDLLPDKDAAKGFYAKYEPKEILGRFVTWYFNVKKKHSILFLFVQQVRAYDRYVRTCIIRSWCIANIINESTNLQFLNNDKLTCIIT